MSDVMWVEKYRPKNAEEIIGNERAKDQFLFWLRGWKPRKKAALLYGPPGVGKTTLVRAVAREFKFTLIEMNASDFRTEDKVMHIAGRAATESSFEGITLGTKGALIFLDEVDGIFGREDQGGIAAVLKIIRTSRAPVVLVANNPWDPRLRFMRGPCEMIRFYGIRVPTIVVFLRKIAKKEEIIVEEEALHRIAEKAEGDVRSAVNDLQAFAEGRKILRALDVKYLPQRDRQYNVFDTLQGLFSAKTILQAKKVFSSSEIDRETLILSIHDNLPIQFQNPENLAEAYDHLSKADVYLGRISQKQNWSLLPYALEQISASVVLAAKEGYHYVKYQFPPAKITLMGRTKAMRSIRQDICTRIGAKCHVSKKVANVNFLPFIEIIFRENAKNAAGLAEYFGFDEKMVDYFSGKTEKAEEESG